MDAINSSIESNSSLSLLDENDEYRRRVKEASNIVAMLSLCIAMFGMGNGILWTQIRDHLKRPKALGIGMASQFVVMPLMGFVFVNAMSLNYAQAISVLLVSCCPTGAAANIFAYYFDGDVPLSVTMTAISVLFAFGSMPFNLWFYGMWIDTGKLLIPYESMAVSLVYIAAPVGLGMIIRWKFPTVAPWIAKICGFLGLILITTCVVLQNLAYPDLMTEISWKLYVALIGMPFAGFVVGFTSAWLLKQPLEVRKTVSVECGLQNSALAIGVILVSPLKFEVQKPLLTFPNMYLVFTIILWLFFCCLNQLHNRMCKKEYHETVEGTTFEDSKLNEVGIPVSAFDYNLKPCDFYLPRDN